MVPPEVSICQIWLTKISSTWTLACRCPVTISSYTWSLAVGKEVAGATCRKTPSSTVSSETRTEWITLEWPLTRGVSFHRTSASLSTRAETCQPLEAPTEAARPLMANLSRRHRGKFNLYFQLIFYLLYLKRQLILLLMSAVSDVWETRRNKIQLRFALIHLICSCGHRSPSEEAAPWRQQYEKTGAAAQGEGNI